MKLTKAITSGNLAAARFAKSMVALPALISLSEPYFFLPIEPEQHSQSGEADVSESVVIVTGQDVKKAISDSVAPGSWSWQLSGYIPGNPAEMTNLYTPFLRLNTAMLKKFFEEGRRLTFKDTDCKFYKNVVIQSLTIDTQADCKNKTPVSITLKQINIMSSEAAALTTAQQYATPQDSAEELGEAAVSTPGRDSMIYTAGSKVSGFFGTSLEELIQ